MKEGQHFTQQQKLAVLESVEEIGVRKAAKLAGVHYTTVYSWRGKLHSLGKEAFLAYAPPSRGRGEKRITEAQEKAILDVWKCFPGFGPSQVRGQLRRQGITVSTRTATQVMKANGYKGRIKESKEKDWLRFEASRPLELVQTDIVEWFIHKAKVYLLVLLDDFSRFIVGWRLLEETSTDAVIGMVQESIDRYGKMEEILSDRGFVFYSWRGINRFERYLEEEGIHQTHARPHHPQTLGKIEAFNQRIQKELLRRETFGSVAEARRAIEKWVETYNEQRTHQGLGGFLVPADRFHGRAAQVRKAIAKRIDPDTEPGEGEGIARSIISLEWRPEGTMSLYILGRQVATLGEKDGRKTHD
jgi:transposase InsO family protein